MGKDRAGGSVRDAPLFAELGDVRLGADRAADIGRTACHYCSPSASKHLIWKAHSSAVCDDAGGDLTIRAGARQIVRGRPQERPRRLIRSIRAMYTQYASLF